MTGVIGMNKEAATARFTGQDGPRLSVALGEVTVCGLLVESDEAGHAVSVEPLRRGGRLGAAAPDRSAIRARCPDAMALAQPVPNLL